MGRYRTLAAGLVLLVASTANTQVRAGDPSKPDLSSSGWVAVDTAMLDRMRGGYRMPSGLVLSFGIERVAFVNGELVSQLRISIPDVSKITPEQARELSALAKTQLVQVGPGNVFQGPGNGGLVIQNTLDGQSIRTQTTLDVSVNTLGLFQALNAGDALRNAGLYAPGSP